ncbi:hypothetical protein SAMN05660420_00239 [Desulfuromusa kysingii]|uniref:Uncharacterized protein n=1 Tax=Desulfuromusa kysingii TaxID=37625 RepID=A0A1H3VRH9_9BACT|nr:hypothetical protein [Desulfuromusa kysingii]SDZ77369.1 hypothetical protein SAMN05660420_00239 [Desulfuromusa kysingii]
MNWDNFMHYLDYFRTDQVMQRLQDWNVGELSTNPWFLGGFAAIILITYLIGWKAIAGFLVGIGGFALVLSLAVGKGTGVEGIAGGGLWILVGGGAAAMSLFIYLVFIKSE